MLLVYVPVAASPHVLLDGTGHVSYRHTQTAFVSLLFMIATPLRSLRAVSAPDADSVKDHFSLILQLRINCVKIHRGILKLLLAVVQNDFLPF